MYKACMCPAPQEQEKSAKNKYKTTVLLRRNDVRPRPTEGILGMNVIRRHERNKRAKVQCLLKTH